MLNSLIAHRACPFTVRVCLEKKRTDKGKHHGVPCGRAIRSYAYRHYAPAVIHCSLTAEESRTGIKQIGAIDVAMGFKPIAIITSGGFN